MKYTLAILATIYCSTASADAAKWVFSQLAPSTVSIVDEEGGSGSGTIIAVTDVSADILTCYHVIEGVAKLRVNYDSDGAKILSVPAVVVRQDKDHDLAIVRAENPQHRPAISVATVDPELYDEMFAVASPLGLQRQSAIERLNTKDAGKWWSFTGTAIPGMSGGALVDEHGRIVCVLRATMSNEETEYNHMGACVPVTFVRAFLKGQTK